MLKLEPEGHLKAEFSLPLGRSVFFSLFFFFSFVLLRPPYYRG